MVLFAGCSAVGLHLRCFLPKQSSIIHKFLFSLLSGFFLVVLIPQNLVYFGVPVRISAWFILSAALVQLWLARLELIAWTRKFCADIEIRAVAVVILLVIAFHGLIPIKQGLEWYYGKGYSGQLDDVLLAEFLKEEPYSTTEQDIGLHPWLLASVGFRDSAEQLGMSPGPGLEMIGLKEANIACSIVTAENSVWSGTNAKGGYAATVIFSIALLAICVYVFLRETGASRFFAGAGALLAAFLPAVTRLTLNGLLSQGSVLFIFPFFGILLRQQDLSARSFTLFYSLTLAYLVAAHSEIAPIGFCVFFLGVMFVRRDQFRAKRLMLMSTILLAVLINPYYLSNFIQFLVQQYYNTVHAPFLEQMAPRIFTLPGWSELIFGVIPSSPWALFFDGCTVLLGLLFLAGTVFLSGRDRLIFGAILLPFILVSLFLATHTENSIYPIAKMILSILPFLVAPVFVALSKVVAKDQNRWTGVVKKSLCAMIIAAAAAGSVRYYSEVLDDQGALRYAREIRFVEVCRELEEVSNKRIVIFETHPLLTPWLCYHARHNDVYFDGRFLGDPAIPQPDPFSKMPDLQTVDFVATRDQLVDLRTPGLSCLILVDDNLGEDRKSGRIRFGLGPPARLRFLAIRAISANLTIRLAPGPDTTIFPVDYFLTDKQGHVSGGELRGGTVDIRRINFPRGLSTLQLSVRPKESNLSKGPSIPILAQLDGVELSQIDLHPGG